MSRHLVALLWLIAAPAFAQSADQQVLSAVASPSIATPGQPLTYTVTLRNNGPDAAINGGINVGLDNNVTYVSAQAPAGFTCFALGGNITCAHPSFASGSTAVITLQTTVAPHLVNFPDSSVSSFFYPSGLTTDPVPGNNAVTTVTPVDSPQIDLALSVSDTRDPVGPDQDIAYAIAVVHNGPDVATNVNVNVYNNGTLRFRSVSAPAGFTCTPPPVGGVPLFTCSAATLAPGNYAFGVVLRAEREVLGANDGTVSVHFDVSGVGNDTNPANNSETETTAYVTPDVDMSISADDLPDPATLGGTFEYLVTITSAGPDTATNAVMTMYNNGTLHFVSMEAAAGFVCTLPAVGAAPAFSCVASTFANGATADFIVTVRPNVDQIPQDGGTVASVFSTGSSEADPLGGNNMANETTFVASTRLFADSFEQ